MPNCCLLCQINVYLLYKSVHTPQIVSIVCTVVNLPFSARIFAIIVFKIAFVCTFNQSEIHIFTVQLRPLSSSVGTSNSFHCAIKLVEHLQFTRSTIFMLSCATDAAAAATTKRGSNHGSNSNSSFRAANNSC